jgi:6-pyruvoyltetrahydropterin/6-carboxytetrahydropterin synthase
MSVIRVTKEFNFEMAHALMNYDGPCRNIHGHSYKLFVTVIGVPSKLATDPKLGMVIDFTDLKQLITQNIIEVFDHAFVLSDQSVSTYNEYKHEMFSKTIYVPYQPTCENLIIDFADIIAPLLPPQAKLFSLKLYETATSYAEWHASDNNM